MILTQTLVELVSELVYVRLAPKLASTVTIRDFMGVVGRSDDACERPDRHVWSLGAATSAWAHAVVMAT